jgi:hypothetical protein
MAVADVVNSYEFRVLSAANSPVKYEQDNTKFGRGHRRRPQADYAFNEEEFERSAVVEAIVDHLSSAISPKPKYRPQRGPAEAFPRRATGPHEAGHIAIEASFNIPAWRVGF